MEKLMNKKQKARPVVDDINRDAAVIEQPVTAEAPDPDAATIVIDHAMPASKGSASMPDALTKL